MLWNETLPEARSSESSTKLRRPPAFESKPLEASAFEAFSVSSNKSESTMESSQKYSWSDFAERTSCSGSGSSRSKASSKRHHMPAGKGRRNLHEPGQTMTSVGHKYRNPKEEEDVFSASSHTIGTNEGHSIHLHQNLIGNMQEMKLSSLADAPRPASNRSMASVVSSRSLRSRISQKPRRKRGSSLERDISRTILETATSGVERAHFLVSVEETRSIKNDSLADHILQDLGQTEAVIDNEFTSIHESAGRCRFSRSRQLPSTLPAIISQSVDEQTVDFQDSVSENAKPILPGSKTDVERASTPIHFQETQNTESMFEPIGESAEPVELLNTTMDTNWSTFSDANFFQEAPIPKARLSPPQIEDRYSSMFSNVDSFGYPRTQCSSNSWAFRDETPNVSSPCPEADDWTTFDVNPFENQLWQRSSAISQVESPSSVVDFRRSLSPARPRLSKERHHISTKVSI